MKDETNALPLGEKGSARPEGGAKAPAWWGAGRALPGLTAGLGGETRGARRGPGAGRRGHARRTDGDLS